MNSLFRNRFLKVLAALLLLAAVYAAVYRLSTGDAEKLMKADQPELAWLTKEFGLNAEQSGKVKSIHSRFDAECYQMCKNLAASQEELHQLIADNPSITPEVKAALSKTARLREHCRNATLHYMYEISAVMTPEQAARYRDTMSKSMMAAGRVPHLSEPGELHEHMQHHREKESPDRHD